MAARVVDTQLLTASVVPRALVPVLAGGPEAEGVSRLVEGVAGVASADHAAKVGGALLLTQTILGPTRVLMTVYLSPSVPGLTDLGVGDASAHYEGVARAAGVPVAVHPVAALSTPGPVTEQV